MGGLFRASHRTADRSSAGKRLPSRRLVYGLGLAACAWWGVPVIPAQAVTVPTISDVDMANLSTNERELSIAVSPTNPDVLVAGANLRPGGQVWYVSSNGGRTWSNGALPFGTLTVPGVSSPSMSDPSIDFDTSGNAYYGALAHGGDGQACTLFVTVSNAGSLGTWSDPASGVVEAGDDSPLLCHDKEDILVDRLHNNDVYAAWTPFGNSNDRQIVFSRDLNGVSDGFSFSAETPISDGTCFNHGAALAEDAAGKLYLAWVHFCSGVDNADPATIQIASSTDHGGSWSSVTDVVTFKNVETTSTLNTRSRSFPSIDVDQATGRVFVVYAGLVGSSSTDGDIDIVSSADGTSWSSPIRVNQDSGTSEQVDPWIDVGKGRIHVVYYSRADDGININLHLAYGAASATPSFTEVTVSSAGTPTSTGFLGDYTGTMLGSDDVLHPAWGDGRSTVGGQTDGYTARVNFSPPTTVSVNPPTQTLQVAATATVTAHVTGLNGENETFIPVSFTVTGSGSPSPASGTGTTGAGGTAAFSFSDTKSGTDTVHVFADLDENGTETAGEGVNATVVWEPGPPASLTLTPATDTNTVDDTHTVTADVRDQYGNAVQPVTVRFAVTGANGVLGSPTSGSATTSGGLATFSYSGAMPGVDTIAAFADTNNDGVRDPAPSAHEPQGTASKTWVLPPSTEGGKVTGDGTITGAGFSLSAQKPVGKPEKGNFSYTAAGKVVVSTSITSVVVSGNHATIFGTATINGVGGYVFRLDVVDAGEPPATDSLRLRLSDGSDTGTQNLTTGNLQVH